MCGLRNVSISLPLSISPSILIFKNKIYACILFSIFSGFHMKYPSPKMLEVKQSFFPISINYLKSKYSKKITKTKSKALKKKKSNLNLEPLRINSHQISDGMIKRVLALPCRVPHVLCNLSERPYSRQVDTAEETRRNERNVRPTPAPPFILTTFSINLMPGVRKLVSGSASVSR